LRPEFDEDFRRDRLTPDFGPFDVLHGGDQPGQPLPAACLASPILLLPWRPHRLPRLPVRGSG